MTELKFIDLEFIDESDKVKVLFLRHFYFYADKTSLLRIGSFKISKNSLFFDASEKRVSKFYDIIENGLKNLRNNITEKKTIYIYKGSGIPLIGNGSFGIIDRGSSLIEIKPVCGCNLSCMYCSVNEDRRNVDFLVEKDYLVDELKKVVSIKKNDVEVHIGCNGEPLLYAPLIELVNDIRLIPKVTKISMDTNATLLTQPLVDELIKAGLTRFNVSINSLDEPLAKKIACKGYSARHVIDIAQYISKTKTRLTLAPVWMFGVNDAEIEKIIKFGKTLNADIGIQNFLKYQFGKNPVKEMPMDEFYEKLKALEKKHNAKLVLSAKDFEIKPDASLKKVFRKDEVVDGIIMCGGRLPGEKIAAAKDRTISVFGCTKKTGSKVRIRISREKHNIYSGVCI